MASDERDRRFDQALARHLRPAAPSGAAARWPARESGACPDSETLAAYHERSLLPEEMNFWKGHVVGCVSESGRSEEHTSELQSQSNLVCRLLLEKKKKKKK